MQIFAEDDDSWLFKDAEKLESELENWGAPDSSKGWQEDSFDPENLIDGLKEFVDNISGYEGAEIPEGELRNRLVTADLISVSAEFSSRICSFTHTHNLSSMDFCSFPQHVHEAPELLQVLNHLQVSCS